MTRQCDATRSVRGSFRDVLAPFGIEMLLALLLVQVLLGVANVWFSLPLWTAVAHNGVGWVGMVLTDPLFRGRGFATALMGKALEHLDSLVETVKLDASAEGEPLYRKLGFVEEAVIERWVSDGVVEGAAVSGVYVGNLRHAGIPVDALAECEGAWAGGRTGSSGWYFGPCYGLDSGAVELVARALLAGRGRAYWDLFPAHTAAAVAGRLGFAPSRRLLRMVRGVASPTPADVYAIAGFEWG